MSRVLVALAVLFFLSGCELKDEHAGLCHVICYSGAASIDQSQVIFRGYFAAEGIVPPTDAKPYWSFWEYKVNGTCVVGAPRPRKEKR